LKQVFLGEAVSQVQKVQQVGVFQEQGGAGLGELGQFLANHRFGLFGNRGSLEQHAVHALAQGAHRP